MQNHYDWLNKHFREFCMSVGVTATQFGGDGGIVSHGDKCYSCKGEWEEHGIPFTHGAAIYLLSYFAPFSDEVRNTHSGWVAPSAWVIANYKKFVNNLPNP